MTRVKICGITRAPDRDAAVEAGADALGFIVGVDVETPREITATRAADLVAGLPPFVTSVLVTMAATVGEALELHDRVGADAIQVHGTLSPGEVAELRERTAADVLVAAGPEEAPDYADVADAVLVDSVDEAGGGGTGETHDWGRTRAVAAGVDVPVVLAGGLTPDNVGAAVETVDPYGVDTASGVECKGGVKDHDAVHAFVAAARQSAIPAGGEGA
jgi:phosphoribosylanthranilate isomerase